MPRRAAHQLADDANDQLASLGGVPGDGSFICPVCLCLRPMDKATRAHFPAESIRGVHATTLSCEPCNSLIGGTYEPEGVDRFSEVWSIAFGPPDGGLITGRALIEQADGRLGIKLQPSGSRDRRSEGRVAATLAGIRS